jgi:mercuric reductase
MAQQVSDVDAAINILQSNDMVVFGEDGEPTGAYPFTIEAREHQILVNGYQVHAMCALDALAVSPMFGIDTEINSQCRVTSDPIHIQQASKTIKNMNETGDVHFGIVWGAAEGSSCCADSLCMEMIFLRDGGVAEQWLAEAPENREIFTLPESVEFASEFFVPLMRN